MQSFSIVVKPDWEGFLKTIRREGTPQRIHFIELFLDAEINAAVAERFNLGKELEPSDPWREQKLYIEIQRFLGYDYACCGVGGLELTYVQHTSADSAELPRQGGRAWMDESKGPIQTWEDFEDYPWPRREDLDTSQLEWFDKNLPDDMTLVGRGIAHYDENLCWLFGYESLCYALCEQPDLVDAVRQKVHELTDVALRTLLDCERVSVIWASDDMGYRGGLLLGPGHTRELVLTGHKYAAEVSHAAGRPYLLHSCGNLSEIMEDLIEDVRIDAKHSFEDTIEDVCEVKRQYGDRLSLLGGIDVDFLCQADEGAVRRRVRETIEVCQPGGGWFLGTGNSVANYVPLDNYLAMLDEGRCCGS